MPPRGAPTRPTSAHPRRCGTEHRITASFDHLEKAIRLASTSRGHLPRYEKAQSFRQSTPTALAKLPAQGMWA
jgi:hypothetical protein